MVIHIGHGWLWAGLHGVGVGIPCKIIYTIREYEVITIGALP